MKLPNAIFIELCLCIKFPFTLHRENGKKIAREMPKWLFYALH